MDDKLSSNEKTDENEVMIESENGLEPDFDYSSTLDIYPLTKVNIEKEQWSISHVKELHEAANMIILDPDFQRDYVWGKDSRKKSELIESILMKIPLPVIYLFQKKDGDYQVVDGRQRLQTILDFMDNKFAIKGVRILKGCEGLKFSDLPPKSQMMFKGFQLFFYIIAPSNPERLKYDIFDRVNRGGTKLNNQEMRNALYCGESTKLLNRLSESEAFLSAAGKRFSNTRKKGDYVILRLLSFFMYWEGYFSKARKPFEYKGDLEDFLAKSMEYINHDLSSSDREQLTDRFKKAMNRISEVIGQEAFRFASKEKASQRRPINMLLIDTLGYLFMKEDDWDFKLGNVDFDALKSELDGTELFNGKNDSTDALAKRREKVIELSRKYDKTNQNTQL